MVYTKETTKKIKELLKTNPELKDKILSGDLDAIRDIGIISGRGITPEEVVAMIDNGKQEELYNYAKKLIGLRELYMSLCLEINKENVKKK